MKKESKLTFEEAIGRLEFIVKQLENPDVKLEDSLMLFEEGIKLANFCSLSLDEAQQKVSILMKHSDGSIVEEDFSSQENG